MARTRTAGTGRRLWGIGVSGVAVTALLGGECVGVTSSLAGASSPRFSGAPIVLATESVVNTPVGSVPQIFAALKASARTINKAGGIHGHQVLIRTCSTAANPNSEVMCANDAVAEGATAFVGELNLLNPGGVEAVLANAKVADLAPFANAPPTFASDVAFPIVFGPGAYTACVDKGLQVLTGKATRATLVDLEIPGASIVVNSVARAAKAQRTTAFPAVGVGLTTTDFSPIVAQVATNQPNTVITLIPPGQIPAFAAASTAAGEKWSYCFVDGSVPTAVVAQLGNTTPVYMPSELPPISAAARYPAVRKFVDQMKNERSAGDHDANLDVTGYFQAFNAWLGMQIFKQVAESIKGTVDHTTFLAALQHTKVDLGVVPPVNFAEPIGSGQFPRVFNAKVYLDRWDPAKHEDVLVPSVTVANSFSLSGLG